MVKRAEIKRFLPIEPSTLKPSTKFGGQPDWLEEPEWPISKEFSCPMHFVCQIKFPSQIFPGCSHKVAYLFVTQDEDAMAETWDPFAGDNAVIIQPGGQNTTNTQDLTHGPTLDVSNAFIRRYLGECNATEFTVELEFTEEPSKEDIQQRSQEDSDFAWELEEVLRVNKIGGVPFSWQNDMPKGDWLLLLQLFENRIPVWLNLGGDGGVGHILVNKEATKGIFRWDG